MISRANLSRRDPSVKLPDVHAPRPPRCADSLQGVAFCCCFLDSRKVAVYHAHSPFVGHRLRVYSR